MKTTVFLAAAACASLGAGSAVAQNFVFPNGDTGFRLMEISGVGNCCTLGAAFGPDSDTGVPSGLDLTTPTAPTLFNSTGDGRYRIQFSLLGAPDAFLVFPDAPDRSGLTQFRHVVGDNFYDISLQFGPGVVSNWTTFSPRSAPGGASFGATFDLDTVSTADARSRSAGDAFMTINVSYNNQPVSYALAAEVPEPASWALMIGGFGLVGSALRRKALARA